MLLRVVCGLMALLMFFAVGLQYNDPDPLWWMVLYGLAGFVSAIAALLPARYPWPLPAAIGLAALVWAATIVPTFWGDIDLTEMFAAWEMHDVLIEEARECFGLAIIAAWMAVLVAARLTARREAPPSLAPVP